MFPSLPANHFPHRARTLFAGTGLAGLMALLLAGPAAAQVALGSAAGYAVLGASTVTNIGATTVTGDLGVSPGNSITGFPPGVVTGTLHAGDASAAQAQMGITAAYNTLENLACNTPLTGDLGNRTLTPGTYCFASSAVLNGPLTLDAQGNANAQFVFQIGSTLTAASGSRVLLTNGATACNVAWQVGSSATLGTTSFLAGNILAFTSITLNSGAAVAGRALARNGAVTLDSATVGGCPAVVPPPVGGAGTASIPTLSEWGVLLLSSLLGMAAWMRHRRGAGLGR